MTTVPKADVDSEYFENIEHIPEDDNSALSSLPLSGKNILERKLTDVRHGDIYYFNTKNPYFRLRLPQEVMVHLLKIRQDYMEVDKALDVPADAIVKNLSRGTQSALIQSKLLRTLIHGIHLFMSLAISSCTSRLIRHLLKMTPKCSGLLLCKIVYEHGLIAPS